MVHFLKARFFLPAVCLFFFLAEQSLAANCTSVTYTSYKPTTIKYTFGDYQGLGSSYECGQYANGDWWVVAKGNPKGVNITSMTPSFSGGRHGYDVNPVKSENHLDSLIGLYREAPDPLPKVFETNGEILSILKAASAPKSGTGQWGYECDTEGNDTKSRSCIQFLVVLTVVEQAPSNPADLFRPGYAGKGGTKKEFRVSDLNLSLVGNYNNSCCSAKSSVTYQKVYERHRWVQTDHLFPWFSSESVHAKDNYNSCYWSNKNYPNSYGGCLLTVNGTSALRFMLDDFNYNNTTHKNALIAYVQYGIDLWSVTEVGGGWDTKRSLQSGATPFLGGVFNGRKIPVVFAAGMLNDINLKAAARDTFYSENDQVYYAANAKVALFGEPGTEKGYFDGIKQQCGGNAPNSSNERNGWQNPSVRDPYGWVDGALCTNSNYQNCCISKPFGYTALAVRMMGIEHVFNHDPFWDYAKRWREVGKWAKPDGWAQRPFNAEQYHGTERNSGGYTTQLGEQMWSAFKNVAQIPTGIYEGNQTSIVSPALQVFPNPAFRDGQVTIKLPAGIQASHLSIYDNAGNLVRKITVEKIGSAVSPGAYSGVRRNHESSLQLIKWNGIDVKGEKVMSGVYVYFVHNGNGTAISSGKIILVQ